MLLIHIIIQITPYSFNSFMSDATNDSVNNLPSEEDAGSIKLQRLDDASDVQLTPISDRQKRKRKQRVL